MVASTTKHMWYHPVFKHKGGLSTTRLIGLIPTVQDQRLNRLAQSSDETIKTFLKKEQIRQAYEKLWIQAAGDKEKTPSIWQLKPVTEVPKYGDEEKTSGWQVATPKTSSLKPRNWRKVEFAKWTKRVSQGQAITSFEWERTITFWIKNYRGTYSTGSLEQRCRWE